MYEIDQLMKQHTCRAYCQVVCFQKLHMGWHARSEIGFVQMVDDFLVDWIIGVCAVSCNCFVRRCVSHVHMGNLICC